MVKAHEEELQNGSQLLWAEMNLVVPVERRH
jgi:hypothetical protein